MLIGVLPFSLVTLRLLQTERKELLEQSQRELMGLARGLSAELDNRLTDLLKDSRVIASLPEIVSMDPAQQRPLLQQLYVQYYTYGQLAVADMDGQLQVVGKESPLVSIAHVPSYQRAAQGKQSWVIFPALFNDNLILHVHTPIFNADGVQVGVLGSPVAFPSLASSLESINIGGAVAFVLDETGRVLIHPDAAEATRRLDYTSWINLPPGGMPAGFGTARYTVDGEARVAGYAPVPNFGWTIVVERPESEILAPAVSSGNLTAAALIGGILLSLALAYGLARSLTEPVRRLAEAARALGRGSPLPSLPKMESQSAEISSLIASFNQMHAAVVDRENSLRQHLSAMEAAIDGMAILQDGYFMYANQALAKMHGFAAPDKLVGMQWRQLCAPKEAQRITNEILPQLQSEGMWRGEMLGLRQDGGQFYEEMFVSQISGQEWVCVFRDLTERKQSEDALRQAQKMKSLGVLAGGIAHDFNNLLAAIMGHSSLALGKMTTESPAFAHVDKTIKAAERAADLTRQLLAYAGKGQFRIETFDINELITENSGLLETVLPPHVQLLFDLDPALSNIRADKGQVQQVVMNLVINAAESIVAEAGEVYIATGATSAQNLLTDADETKSIAYLFNENLLPTQTYVCLEVRDNGSGMSLETLKQIFDPFFSTKAFGSGLGLSATLGIAKTLQGGIQVISELGKGSAFRLFVPAAIQEVKKSRADAHLPKMPGATILVVEDEDYIRDMVCEALETQGMNVLSAANGQEAVDIFQTHHQSINVTLLDMRMPVMGGNEAIRLIKQIDPNAKVILMSGYTETDAPSQILNQPTVQFLQKPYTIDQLLQRIQRFSAPQINPGNGHASARATAKASRGVEE
ncbi:MAG: cache domain-containing protein [Caldilineaceae bacterium]